MTATAHIEGRTREFARVIGPFLTVAPAIIAIRAPQMDTLAAEFFRNDLLYGSPLPDCCSQGYSSSPFTSAGRTARHYYFPIRVGLRPAGRNVDGCALCLSAAGGLPGRNISHPNDDGGTTGGLAAIKMSARQSTHYLRTKLFPICTPTRAAPLRSATNACIVPSNGDRRCHERHENFVGPNFCCPWNFPRFPVGCD